MKVYQTEDIRNVALVGHQGAGKSSVAEAMIYNTGALSRLGKVSEGNSVSDYLPEETKKKISVSTTLLAIEHRDKKVNLLDTPGFMDFYGEVRGSLRVADSLLMVIDAVAGAQVSTEIIWEEANERDTSRIIFVNKMDRENANFEKTIESLREKLTKNIIPVTIPIGEGEDFRGIVNIIDNKAFTYEDGKPTEIEIPADMEDNIAKYREMLYDAAAEGDDDIMEKYLDGEELSKKEVLKGLHNGVKNAKVTALYCGSATNNIGIDELMDAIFFDCPDPIEAHEEIDPDGPFAVLVFKTMTDPYVGRISYFKVMQGRFKAEGTLFNANQEKEEKISSAGTMMGKNQIAINEFAPGDIGMLAKLPGAKTGDTLTTKTNPVIVDGIDFPIPSFTVAIAPKSKADEDKLGNAITKLIDEDPTLRLEKNVETKQTLLTAIGEAHVDIVVDRLLKKFGVDVEILDAQVPYRETIKGSAKNIQGRHKKQSGGHGQFGDIIVDMEPNPDMDFEFKESIFGGSVPKNYIPAVEKGFRESMQEGVLAGFPVTNISVNLKDGSYHPVDSSEMSFKVAAS
ncbi:MAG: elongation factor G, partial [Clostridiales bacterium]